MTLFSGDRCLFKYVLTTGLSTNLPAPLVGTFALPLDRSGIFGLFALIILNWKSYSIRSSNYYCVNCFLADTSPE